MKRWLFSYWPPLLLLVGACVFVAYDFGFRHSYFASHDRVGALDSWGESYRVAWTQPSPRTPPLCAIEGDLASPEWDTRILNSVAVESDPSWCDDVVVFASNRGGTQDYNLYWARRIGNGFSSPEPFPAAINGAFNERSPSLAQVGDEWLLLFTSNRTYGTVADHDVFIARGVLGGEWSEAAIIGELSTAADERSVALRPDGAALYFTRPDRQGLAVYESWKHPRGGWSEPAALSVLGHAENAAWLALSAGGSELFLARGEGVVLSELQLLRALPGPSLFDGPYWLIALIALLLLLLRGLARQWPTLEIIYRCLLFSALLHLLLWLWLRDTEVESHLVPLNGPGEPASAPIELTLEMFEEAEDTVEVAHGESVQAEAAVPQSSEEWRRLEAAWESLTAKEPQLAHADSVAAERPTFAISARLVPTPQQPTAQRAVETVQLESLQTAQQTPSERAEAQSAQAARSAAAERPVVAAPAQSSASPSALPSPSVDAWSGESLAVVEPAVAQRTATAVAVAEAAEPGARPVVAAPADQLQDAAGGARHGSERAVAAQRTATTQSVERPELTATRGRLQRPTADLPAVTEAPVMGAPELTARSARSVTVAQPAAAVVPTRASAPTTASSTAELELTDASDARRPTRRTESTAAPGRVTSQDLTDSATASPPVGRPPSGSTAERTPQPPTAVALSGVDTAAVTTPQGARRGQVTDGSQRVRQPQPKISQQRGVASTPQSALAASDRAPQATRSERDLRPARRASSAVAGLTARAPRSTSADVPVTPRPAMAASELSGVESSGVESSGVESSGAELADAARIDSAIVTTPGEIAQASPARASARVVPQPAAAMRSRVRPPASTTGASALSAANARVPLASSASARSATGASEQQFTPPARAEIEGLSVVARGVRSGSKDATRLRLRPAEPRLDPIEGATVEAQVERIARAVQAPDVPWLSARFGSRKQDALRQFGGDDKTEHAVAQGLAYLASRQRADGSWGSMEFKDTKYGEVTIGKSSLVLLAFLGAGHYPGSGTEYEKLTERAVNFLVAQQKRGTGHFGAQTTAYSHGITTYALAEACLLNPTERLRGVLRAATQQILRNQITGARDRRLNGGWSYYYHRGSRSGVTGYPRVSITGWQLMALKSVSLAGIDVPQRHFDAAERYLVQSWSRELGRFLYSLDLKRLRGRFPTLPGSTPAATFVLQILGRTPDDPVLADAFEYIDLHRPDGWAEAGANGFVQGSGNAYYWYYGTLAMFQHGGARWERWNRSLKQTLLPAQRADGSWKPISIYATYAGDNDDNRSYTTALNVLMLEVYYRYLTPFQEAVLKRQ